jgi:hypothetical protein
MIPDQNNDTYRLLRQKELLRAAERERLAAIAQSGKGGISVMQLAARAYRPALAWFGRRLIDAGRRLQAEGQPVQADEAAGW